MKPIWMCCFMSAAACAQGVQNMDISFMFGPVFTKGVAVVGPAGSVMVSGSVGYSTQISYGYQVATTAAGNLFIELPSTFVFGLSGTVANGVVSSLDRDTWYTTPGVRFKIPTGTRISFYGVLGVGAAFYNERDSVVSGQLVATHSNTTAQPALDVGGGIDFRISRWLSLRADERDFVSAAGYGGTAGHNHLQFLMGVAFHF
jgi:hypothetical protein